MSAACTVRAAREEDATAIVRILNEIIERGSMTILTAPFTVEDQLSYIRGFPGRGVYHVAVGERDGTVLGVQGVEPFSTEPALHHVGDISTFVALSSLRMGIGRNLNVATEHRAVEMGFQKIMATVRSDNPAAIGFYTAAGYRRIGTAHEHARFGNQLVDEVFMEKRLLENGRPAGWEA